MEDTLYRYLAVYNRLPLPMRNAIGALYTRLPKPIRYGRFYTTYRRRIDSFCGENDLARLQDMQFLLLKRTVDFAVRNIPFYKQWKPIDSLDEFSSFPIVTRSLLSDRMDEFIARTTPDLRLPANTGGGTGMPMQFYLHKGLTRPKEKAHFHWLWGQYGYKPRSRILMVRGAPLARNRLFEYQTIENRLSISCYELNEKNIGSVLRAIRDFNPEFIHAYPSALRILLQLMGDPLECARHITAKAAFLGSEGLTQDDRIFFGQFLACPVISWYGHSECAIHGGNAPGSDSYYFYPFYGYMELIDDSDTVIATPGREGRIVATSFDNYVMPFIRYDTGDIGVLGETDVGTTPCMCKVLKSIEGRSQDVILLNDGSRVSLTAFIFGQHLSQFAAIRELQMQQDTPGKVIVRIVPSAQFTERDLNEIREKLAKSVSYRLEISMELVKTIAKTHRGKHRFLIQNTH